MATPRLTGPQQTLGPVRTLSGFPTDPGGKLWWTISGSQRHFSFPVRASMAESTPQGDPNSKNYRVGDGRPPGLPLLIGRTGEVNIVTREKAIALVVPVSAVRKGTVFVVEDGRARARKVATGIIGDVMVEIVEGLKDGEAVIENPPEDLRDGEAVRVTVTEG